MGRRFSGSSAGLWQRDHLLLKAAELLPLKFDPPRGFEPVPEDWAPLETVKGVTQGPELTKGDLKRPTAGGTVTAVVLPKLPGEALAVAGLLKRLTQASPTGSAVRTAPSRPPGR
jgi:hypothetical protein